MARRPASPTTAHEMRTPLLALRRASRGRPALDIDLSADLAVGDDELDAIERLLGSDLEALLAPRH